MPAITRLCPRCGASRHARLQHLSPRVDEWAGKGRYLNNVSNTVLTAVRVGDVLGHDAVTASGMLLLPAGTTLSERQLQRLAEAGVTHVTLRGSAAEREAALQARRAEVDERFSGHDHDQLMQALKQLVIEQAEQALS